MRHINQILTILLSIFFLTCCSIGNRISEEEIEDRALKIASRYDSTNIDIFKTWGCIPRGQNGIWSKNKGDSILYRWIYFDMIDSSIIRIFEYESFIKDFNIKLKYDSSYNYITIIKQKNGLLKISSSDTIGRYVLLLDSISQDSVFSFANPFAKFKELTDLKDSLNFFGVHYYERLGGFIQFYLTSQHVLTYVPDTSMLNPKFKINWINEFSKGKWLDDNWNLRKLDEPIDNG